MNEWSRSREVRFQRSGRRRTLIVFLASAFLVAGVFVFGNTRTHNPSYSGQDRSKVADPGLHTFLDANPNVAPYPDSWRVDLQQAIAGASFRIVVPNTPSANGGNVVAAYLWPSRRAVAIDFPAPAQPSQPLRQNYIELWQGRWDEGDPMLAFQADLARDPAQGKAILDIGGVPALAVQAHSSSDLTQSNPAFIRFVVNGIVFEVSGGESLDLLVGIAKDIIATASPNPSA